MRLYIAGPGLRGGGYPNAARTIELLKEHLDVDAVEAAAWLPESLHLWKLARGSRLRAVASLMGILLASASSLVRILAWNRSTPGTVYVPYPAVFFMALVSVLPTRLRPRCIVDSYISVWDSMFRDRVLGSAGGAASRVVKAIEGRALRAAACVLVDTEANRRCLIDDFGIDPARIRSLPLAIEERVFAEPRANADGNTSRVRVLFIGTLIPLHGLSTLLAAIRELLPDGRYEFRIVGDGQQGQLIADFLLKHGDDAVTWVRGWRTLPQLSDEIAAADICLGLFGGDHKASRVLPFKMYMYLASGRAVISQSRMSTPAGVPAPPIRMVQPGNAPELAEAIRQLAQDPAERQRLATEGRAYYRDCLANRNVVTAWARLLADVSGD